MESVGATRSLVAGCVVLFGIAAVVLLLLGNATGALVTVAFAAVIALAASSAR